MQGSYETQIFEKLAVLHPDWELYFNGHQPIADKYFWAKMPIGSTSIREGSTVRQPDDEATYYVKKVWTADQVFDPTEAPGAKILVSKVGAPGI